MIEGVQHEMIAGQKNSALALTRGLFPVILIALTLISCEAPRSEISALEVKADSIFQALGSEPQIQNGYGVYISYGCILCHGANGEGGVKNKNAQTGEEIPSLTYTAEGYTPEEFKQRTLGGVHTVAKLDTTGKTPPFVMPGWNNMSESELNDLLIYVWSLYPEGEEDDW